MPEFERVRHRGKRANKAKPASSESAAATSEDSTSDRPWLSVEPRKIVMNEYFTTFRPGVDLPRDPKQHKIDHKLKMKMKEERDRDGEGDGGRGDPVTEGDRFLGIDVLMKLITPFLEAARVPGCVPRQTVVPGMREAGVPNAGLKLFKRVLRQEGISLDGGPLAPGMPHPSRPRTSTATRLEFD